MIDKAEAKLIHVKVSPKNTLEFLHLIFMPYLTLPSSLRLWYKSLYQGVFFVNNSKIAHHFERGKNKQIVTENSQFIFERARKQLVYVLGCVVVFLELTMACWGGVYSVTDGYKILPDGTVLEFNHTPPDFFKKRKFYLERGKKENPCNRR